MEVKRVIVFGKCDSRLVLYIEGGLRYRLYKVVFWED